MNQRVVKVLPSVIPGCNVFEEHPLDSAAWPGLRRNISVSHERHDEDDWLGLVRLSAEDKQLEKPE